MHQVCEKWLKERKDRTLSKGDIKHYEKIVVALSETIRLMKEIDEVIENHGGWPDAFTATSIEIAHVKDQASIEELATLSESELADSLAPHEPFASARESQSMQPAPTPPHLSEVDGVERTCIIRDVFSKGGARDRETAIRDLAQAMGFERTGTRIREDCDNLIRTAVRRGILTNGVDGISLRARSIADYDRDFLKEQFLASLGGRAWHDRDDAVRDFARWFGFRRTGPVLDERTRSLINGLLREDRLESQGTQIRGSGPVWRRLHF
jgi:hypothetical protein